LEEKSLKIDLKKNVKSEILLAKKNDLEKNYNCLFDETTKRIDSLEYLKLRSFRL